MHKKSIFLAQLLLISLTCLSQKNPTKLIGSVELDKVSSIDQTEVTIQEYVYFIINNGFDVGLFPESQSVSATASVFFDDLRKQKNFQFIELRKQHPGKQIHFGETDFILTKRFNTFFGGDTTGFSIWLPMVEFLLNRRKSFVHGEKI